MGLNIVVTDEKEPLKKPHAELLCLVNDEKNDFILYKNKRIIHRKILKEYLQQYGEEKIGSIIKRATENQTIIFTSDD